MYLPLAHAERLLTNGELRHRPAWWWLQLTGRLQAGATAEQVRGKLEGPFRAAAIAGHGELHAGALCGGAGTSPQPESEAVPRLIVESAARGIYDPVPEGKLMASILGAVVGLVLLIVCTNTANLLL